MKKFTLLFLSLSLLTACQSAAVESTSQPDTVTQETENTSLNPESMQLVTEDITPGTGETAKAGDLVSVHYTGTLTDGTKFDSSKDRGTPFNFTLGAGQVIEGWDKGVAGMKVGGVRKLTIPSSMGYGNQGVPGVIPGGATLIFEVELLEIK